MIPATLVRRNRAAGALAIAGTVGLAALLALGGSWTAWAMLLSLVVLVAGAAWYAWWRPTKRPANLEVDGSGVRVDGAVLARRSALRAADAARLPSGAWRVELRRWLGPAVRVVVNDAGVAREVLAALGFDRRRGTSSFVVRRAWAPSLDATFLVTLVLLSLAAFSLAIVNSLLVLLVPMLVPLFALYAAWPFTLTVGSDGFAIGRRFVPFTAVTHVGPRFVGIRGLEIWLDGGERISLDTAPELLRGGASHDHVASAAQEAWTRARQREGAATSTLVRGERTVQEWIASLRTGGSGYRVAAVDDEELLAVVVDAGSSQEVRAAAAVALAAKPEHAPRLRVAADELADPVVRRIALTALDDEGHLEEELGRAFRAK